MDKTEINERFIAAINSLLKDKGLSKTGVAASLGVKPSKFSEILNNRMNAGTDIIALLCETYSFSAIWILNGRGPMLMPGEIKGRSKPAIAVGLDIDFNRKNNIGNDSVGSGDYGHKDEESVGTSLASEPTLVNPRKHIKKSDNPTDGIPLITIEAVAGFPTIDEPGRAIADCDRYVVPEFADKGAQFLIRVSGSSMYPKYSSGDILACKKITERLFFQWGKIYVIDSSQGILVKRVFPDNDHLDMIKLVSDNKDHYPPFDIPKSDIRSLSIVIGAIRFE